MSDYQSQQAQTPKFQKTILDHFGFKLTAKPQSGSTRKPTLQVRIKDNQPSFLVYTNVEGDKDNGRIESKTDTATFFTILTALDDIIKGANDRRYTVEIRDRKFIGNKLSDAPMLDSRIIVGKDKSGIVWIAVTSYDEKRPAIRFPFKLSEKATASLTIGETTEKVQESDISRMVATSYLQMLKEMVPHIMRVGFFEKPRDAPKSNQNQNNRGNSGGYQNQRQTQSIGNDDSFGSTSFEEDDFPL